MSSPNPSDNAITECEKRSLNYNWSMTCKSACLLTKRYNTSMKKHDDKEGRPELDGDVDNGEQLSEEELKGVIIEIIDTSNSNSIRDMSKVMKVLKEKFGDKCDFQKASFFVKEKLAK